MDTIHWIVLCIVCGSGLH